MELSACKKRNNVVVETWLPFLLKAIKLSNSASELSPMSCAPFKKSAAVLCGQCTKYVPGPALPDDIK